MSTISASAIVAAGKAAVEAELTSIESDLSAAKTVAETKGAALLAALNSHVQAHVAEVSAAQALQTRAAALVPSATTNASVVGSSAPAATLTAPAQPGKVLAFIKAVGWKPPLLTAIGLYLMHNFHVLTLVGAWFK
jgi:hypothetical protein